MQNAQYKFTFIFFFSDWRKKERSALAMAARLTDVSVRIGFRYALIRLAFEPALKVFLFSFFLHFFSCFSSQNSERTTFGHFFCLCKVHNLYECMFFLNLHVLV